MEAFSWKKAEKDAIKKLVYRKQIYVKLGQMLEAKDIERRIERVRKNLGT